MPILNTKVILQCNPSTGETNVSFLTDPTQTIDDCLITSPGWEGSTILLGTVKLVGDGALLKELDNKTFRWEGNSDGAPLVEMSKEDVESALNRS